MMGDATSEPEDEKPERDTYVSEFRLDLFEVTVGRFRKFVEQYSGPPPDGAGANPNLEGTGWNSAWDDYLPADRESLEAQIVDSAYCTWTPTPNEETRPINCISWHLAFAFCIYDLGRLPTEAEWERAAAGGEEDRPYPWEPTEYSEPTSDLAVYDCPAGCAGLGPYDIGFVGSKPAGAGRYGHLDLAGSVSEWVLDWYRVDYYSHADFCTDCVNLSKPASNARRVLRGGNYQSDTDLLRAAKRDMSIPEAVSGNSPHGVRCAR
jgi:sulfatase modifying factor 1